MKQQITATTMSTKQSPADLSWDEIMSLREQIVEQKETAEAALKVLSDEILFRLESEKISGKVIGNWSVSKNTLYNFEVTIEQARELGAVKETIDKPTLKQLYLQGVQIPGIKKTEYVAVREVVKNNKQ